MHWYYWISGAMTEENGTVVILVQSLHHIITQWQPRRESNNPAQLLGVCQPRVKGQSAALAESAQNDLFGGELMFRFGLLNQSAHMIRHFLNALFILFCVLVQAINVEPARHAHAPVQADWCRRRIWKDESHIRSVLGHALFELLAPALARVAQSVHEDDGTLARGFGLDFVRISLHDDPLGQFLVAADASRILTKSLYHSIIAV